MTQTGLLVFARCVGFVFRAPGLSHPAVPPPVRAGIALVLAIAVAPAAHVAVAIPGATFALALVSECGIGAAIGFAASILYDGAYAGGRAVDDYVGIRASVPNAQVYAPSGFGRVWSLVFTAGFFLLGGYRVVILTFAQTFDRLPPATLLSPHALAAFAIALPQSIVEAALLVAAPAMALVFVAQCSLGALTRVIPRFTAFTLSFPIVFAMALLATAAAVPVLYAQSGHPWIVLPFLRGR